MDFYCIFIHHIVGVQWHFDRYFSLFPDFSESFIQWHKYSNIQIAINQLKMHQSTEYRYHTSAHMLVMNHFGLFIPFRSALGKEKKYISQHQYSWPRSTCINIWWIFSESSLNQRGSFRKTYFQISIRIECFLQDHLMHVISIYFHTTLLSTHSLQITFLFFPCYTHYKINWE